MTPAWRDRWHPRVQRLLAPVDFRRRWFRELQRHERHLTPAEFWATTALERAVARTLEDTGPAYWTGHRYHLYRQVYYHRHRCFHAIAATVPPGGWLLEYGCGIAPVSAWLARRRRDVRLALVDLPTPAFAYARWRLPQALTVEAGSRDVARLPTMSTIVCLEVLEHVPAPLDTVRTLLELLAPGGTLHVNFIQCSPGGGNDARAQAERPAVLEALAGLTCVVPLTEDGGTGVYRR